MPALPRARMISFSRRIPAMLRRILKRKLILILACLLLIYSLGYGVCRYQRWIVHYTASADGKCTYHGVAEGDYKLGSMNQAATVLYTPLRYVELAYWKLREPVGSAC